VQPLSCLVGFDGLPLQPGCLRKGLWAGHLIRVTPQLRGLSLVLPDLLRQPYHLHEVNTASFCHKLLTKQLRCPAGIGSASSST
jgi:hypothetical protein